MFRVMPVTRFAAAAAGGAAVALLRAMGADSFVLLTGAAVAVWFQFYLQGLRVTVAGGLLIKRTGNIFNRRLVLVLKNISAIHTVSLHPGLPRLIRVFYPDRDFLIVGLTGRQAAAIEKAVKQSVSLS